MILSSKLSSRLAQTFQTSNVYGLDWKGAVEGWKLCSACYVLKEVQHNNHVVLVNIFFLSGKINLWKSYVGLLYIKYEM